MSGRHPEKSARKDRAVLSTATSQWWPLASLVPALAGSLWLLTTIRNGAPAVLLGALPEALLLGTGLSGLVWSRGARTFQYMALASVIGATLSLPAALILGPTDAVALAVISAASFLAAGYLALVEHRSSVDVPDPSMFPGSAIRAAPSSLLAAPR